MSTVDCAEAARREGTVPRRGHLFVVDACFSGAVGRQAWNQVLRGTYMRTDAFTGMSAHKGPKRTVDLALARLPDRGGPRT